MATLAERARSVRRLRQENAFVLGGTPILPVVNSVAPAVTPAGPVVLDGAGAADLTTTDGTWLNTPARYTYQWQLSANGTTGWADVDGETAATIPDDGTVEAGFYRCVVTAVKTIGSVTANSNVVEVTAA